MWNWIKDKMLAGFIVGGIYFLAKIFYDLPKESKTNFFSYNWLSEWINFPVKLYIVIIIVAILLAITQLQKIKTANKKHTSNPKIVQPKNDFENYRSDSFGYKKTKWTWNYKWDYLKGKFIIDDLKPNCPRCDIPMTLNLSDYGDTAVCHKCRLEGNSSVRSIEENVDDVSKEIVRRIQNNEVVI